MPRITNTLTSRVVLSVNSDIIIAAIPLMTNQILTKFTVDISNRPRAITIANHIYVTLPPTFIYA